MAMVSGVSPLGAGSISAMRQQSSIVAGSGGSMMVFSKRSEVCDVGLTRKNDTVDQRLNELQNRRLHELKF
jgi:hypothetical protein